MDYSRFVWVKKFVYSLLQNFVLPKREWNQDASIVPVRPFSKEASLETGALTLQECEPCAVLYVAEDSAFVHAYFPFHKLDHLEMLEAFGLFHCPKKLIDAGGVSQ